MSDEPLLFDIGEPKAPAERLEDACTPYRPGTGPAGETCRGCAHAVRLAQATVFFKCALARNAWTHSRRTDIKLRWPACLRWTPKPIAEARV